MRKLITLCCFLLTILSTTTVSSQEDWIASSQKIPFHLLGDIPVAKAKSIQFPFQMSGGLILVEAYINDQRKPFLLDSGAPNLFLNGKVDKESAKFSAV
ncbi:MAG: hypothetical protein AAF985_21050, partial [Bacteroidota bacterium]